MARRFSIDTIFRGIDRLSQPLGSMHAALRRFLRSMRNGIRGLQASLSRVSNTITSTALAATTAAVGAGVAVAGLMGDGMKFEDIITRAAVKFPGMARAGVEELETMKKQLSATAMAVGESTEFSASQAAGALNFLAMAGFSAEQSIASIPGVVNLATVGNMDLARATDIASDALGAFNLMTDDSVQLQKNLADVNDLLATVSTSANTDIAMLFSTIKDGAPAATSAGQSMHDFGAAAGIMAGSGIKAERAGTALKNMFTRLAAPPSEARKALEKLRVETTKIGVDGKKNVRNVIDIFGDLEKKLADLGNAEQLEMMKNIFGMEALSGVDALMKVGSESFREYSRMLKSGQGITKEMSDKIRDTTLGSWGALLSAIDSVKLKLFNLTKGELRDSIDLMTKFVRTNADEFVNRVGSAISFVINNAAMLWEKFKYWGKIALIIVGVNYAVTALAGAISLLLGVVTLLSSPFILLAVAIGAVTGAVMLGVKWLDEHTNFMMLLGDQIDATVNLLKELKDWFLDLINVDFSPLINAFNKVLAIFKPVKYVVDKMTQGGLSVDTRKKEIVKESMMPGGFTSGRFGIGAHAKPSQLSVKSSITKSESKEKVEIVVSPKEGAQAEIVKPTSKASSLQIQASGSF